MFAFEKTFSIPAAPAHKGLFAHAEQALAFPLADGANPLRFVIAGLRIALEVPDAAEQWLTGKDVFRNASLPPSDPEAVALHPWTPTFDVPLPQ